MISFAVTAKLICIFVFAYAKSWFSHNAAHLIFCLTSYQGVGECGEGGRHGILGSLGKTTLPPTSRTWLSHMCTELCKSFSYFPTKYICVFAGIRLYCQHILTNSTLNNLIKSTYCFKQMFRTTGQRNITIPEHLAALVPVPRPASWPHL